jgi:hypothetical protein
MLHRHFQQYFSFIGGVPGENHRPAVNHLQTLSLNVYRVHLAWVGLKLTISVTIGNVCIGSCKSNYHTITTYKNGCIINLYQITKNMYINSGSIV